jgi:hypothetical protein
MLRTLRLLLATVVVAGVVAGVAVAGGGGSGNFPLLGPDGNAFCDGSGVISGTDGGFGFAIINEPGSATISATVKLQSLKPKTTYFVSLIQGVSDCGTVDAIITTNGAGNGTAHMSEASVSDHAFIGLQEGGFTTVFVTQTYFH